MSTAGIIILAGFAAAMIVGPALLWILGHARVRRDPGRTEWAWRLSAASGLTYALAFNLTFFVQELFLVLPKALTPELRPTLFHNNHDWEGDHPLAELFQGTGALAILISGALFLWLLARSPGRTAPWRLLAIWMAYHGLMQGLPQLAVGAVLPDNDTARAMAYLGIRQPLMVAIGLAALALVPLAALRIGRAILALAPAGEEPRRLMLGAATLPAVAAIALIIPFRVPREPMEVLLPPILVTWIGIAWMQAGAWRRVEPLGTRVQTPPAIAGPLVGLTLLLLLFQLVLRPGIPFF